MLTWLVLGRSWHSAQTQTSRHIDETLTARAISVFEDALQIRRIETPDIFHRCAVLLNPVKSPPPPAFTRFLTVLYPYLKLQGGVIQCRLNSNEINNLEDGVQSRSVQSR